MNAILRFGLMTCLALSLFAGGVQRAAAQDAPRIMIVMDGSGSMWGRIGKTPKLAIATRAVNQLMKRLPGEMEVGLMAYGHRSEGDCGDIQVLVPPQPNSDGKVRKALSGMSFLGKTPIAASLREAAEAMDYQDGPVTVVLVTDGIESCRMDPCAVAEELEAEGFDFTAHVIGFGLKPKEGARLACIAKRTGGKYFPARNARALGRALSAAVLGDDAPNALDQANPAMDEPVADAELPAEEPAAVPESADVEVAAIEPAAPATSSKQKKNTAVVDDAVEPEPEVELALEPEPEAAEPALAAVTVTIAPKGVPDTVPVRWSATPLDDPLEAVVAPEAPVTGPWTVHLSPGEWAVEGLADGYILEDYLTVSAAATAFEIEGFATGADETATDEDMPVDDAEATDDDGDEPAVVDEAVAEEPVTEEPVVEEPVAVGPVTEEAAPETIDAPTAPMGDIMVVAAADTLALPGAGTTTDAGYRCDASDPCGMQDAATGLVFALPPGWATDVPTTSADGQSVTMTLFGPEAADGTMPTLILNPAIWTDGDGACSDTQAGRLCIWRTETEAATKAMALIAPSVVIATQDNVAVEAAPVADGAIVPQDGTWAGTVGTPVVAQCPDGIDAGFGPVVTNLSAPRVVTWGAAFDPAAFAADPAMPELRWTALSPTEWQVASDPMPIPGQPPFMKSVVNGVLTLQDAGSIGGQLVLTAFADGSGTVGLLNAGLARCSVTADVRVTRTGE